MLDFAEKACTFSRNRKRRDLDTDELYALAMTRVLEVIGEAAARVTEAFRSRHPDIPWRSIVGLRNKLIHGYDTIDSAIVWKILKDDLGPLTESLQSILRNESRRSSTKKRESNSG
jgi:uncharacterized protein with HEPN domain